MLIVVFALVVAAGGVYMFRPLPDVGKVPRVFPSAVVSPVDNTMPWPPKPSGIPFNPLSRVVRVTLKTTKGDIILALDGPRAPLATGSFVYLAEQDFFDGTTFHRVIPGFVIQGGDPLSRDKEKRELHGRGGPGYTFPDEINERRLTVGTVAMANRGADTNGSQFFIITAPRLSELDGTYTAFGIVEQGMDVVNAISGVERDDNDNPLEPIVIEDVIVHGGSTGNDLLPGLEVVE